MSATPYRSTPVFDNQTLPAALRKEHRTRSGVWGVIRVIEGEVRLIRSGGTGEVEILTAERPGVVQPAETHRVEPLGAMRMRVDFYDRAPPPLS
jgi:tellurite resistance-related uncharacterized protein